MTTIQKITAYLRKETAATGYAISDAVDASEVEVGNALRTMEASLLIHHDNTKWSLTPMAEKVLELNAA